MCVYVCVCVCVCVRSDQVTFWHSVTPSLLPLQSLQLAPGGLQCGPLPNYTISNGTQSVPVLCSSSPCQYSLVFQSLLATSSYNVSLSGPSLSSVSRQIGEWRVCVFGTLYMYVFVCCVCVSMCVCVCVWGGG